MFRGSGSRRKSKAVTTSCSKHIVCSHGISYCPAYGSSGGGVDGHRLGVDVRSLVGMNVVALLGSLSCKNVRITDGRVFADSLHWHSVLR